MSNDPRESAYLLKCMMDNMSDMIYFKDQDSKFIMVNKATAEWQNGCQPEDMVGKTDFDSYSKEDASRMRADEVRIMETGEPLFGIEEDETWKNGTHAWVSTTKMPLHDQSGAVVGIFGISRDITDHKEAEIRAAKFAEENRRFREELENDLQMASQLQKTFFPTSYPVFSSPDTAVDSLVQFYHLQHAGGVIGGDLCSIRKLSDSKAGIFLCDVMGHGIRAALGTSIVRAVLEEISQKNKDPGQFLTHMNQVLMQLFRQDDMFLFATACYMVLDVTTGAIQVANAGHPLPILLDAGRNRAEEITEDASFVGPGLAIAEDSSYKTVERSLQPGDTILMYTDGVNEAVDADGEEYGEKRLMQSAAKHMQLQLPDLFDSLYTDALNFSADGTLDDDVCLVGFQLGRTLAD